MEFCELKNASSCTQEDEMKMMEIFVIFFIFICHVASAQELYVSTEPASNMATGSIGFRLNSKLFKMNHDGKYDSYRIEPEIMLA